jgi:diaminopimelate decarboxylase
VIPSELLREGARRWGTPLYVTDLDRAAANAAGWRDALPAGGLVAYAVKANPDPALLVRLAAEGFGFEVVGPVELAVARRAGADPAHIVVNGVGQTDADLVDALSSGALVNAESLGALDALLAAGGGRIGLRINPGIDAGAHPHLATGAAASKFGVALAEVGDAISRVRSAGASLESVGAHIGSDLDDPEPFARLAMLLARVAGEAGVTRIDLGGGFRGRPEAYAAAIVARLPDDVRIVVEPGRGIVGDAGWLLTRVVRVQARGHLVLDAGMTELIRPVLYGARHPVTLVEPGGRLPRRGAWELSGPICEAGDRLAAGIDLGSDAGEGALLAIGEAGAYGLAMASTYNGRLRPAQAVIESGAIRLSRRRESLDDVIARDL